MTFPEPDGVAKPREGMGVALEVGGARGTAEAGKDAVKRALERVLDPR